MAVKPEPTPSVLTTLQSEVASEASPMLQFLVSHARTIVIGILLFIVAIAGYWVYSWQAGKQDAVAARDLGGILILSDAGQRLSKLEAYLPSAPKALKGTVLFAMMESAAQLKDYPKLQAVWQAIGDLDPNLKTTAALGTASALAEQGKYKEAAAALNGLDLGANTIDALLVNTQIAAYAEAASDYDRAIAACDTLLKLPEASQDANLWAQKKAVLEQKKAGAAKP